MKARIFWLSFVALFLMSADVFEVSAQTIFKGILLRSKEKIIKENNFAQAKYFDSDPDSDEIYLVYEKSLYEEFSLIVQMKFSVKAYPYRNNRYLQEDIVKYVTREKQNTDSLGNVMLGYLKGSKKMDDLYKRLKKLKDYNQFVCDDTTSYAAAVNTCKSYDCRRTVLKYPLEITLQNGILTLEGKRSFGSSMQLGFYDVKRGKRIEPADLLTTLTREEKMGSVSQINGRSIIVCGNYLTKDDPLLTPYARSLMERDKGYKSVMNVNEYGDQIQSIKVKRINGGYESREIHLPLQLNGCKNTQKVRNRMLDVMFGRSDGDLEELITEGVKKWVPRYGRGSQMLLNVGDGLVSFGFENLSARDNSSNTFIVFDKTTGEEIAVKDLIKDQKGFMDYVNSFNMYFAGFLFDSTNVERGPKVGEDLRSYLKHSGGYLAPFNGWKEFPTSWWFAFSNMDGFVSVEFNTSSSRIFLNYSDIRAFIDPKYYEVLDRAVRSIGK